MTVPNYANSPLPQVDAQGKVIGGIGKFVDALPGLGSANKNLLGNYIPVAHPDTTTFPGSDYSVIAVKEHSQKLHGPTGDDAARVRPGQQRHRPGHRPEHRSAGPDHVLGPDDRVEQGPSRTGDVRKPAAHHGRL